MVLPASPVPVDGVTPAGVSALRKSGPANDDVVRWWKAAGPPVVGNAAETTPASAAGTRGSAPFAARTVARFGCRPSVGRVPKRLAVRAADPVTVIDQAVSPTTR